MNRIFSKTKKKAIDFICLAILLISTGMTYAQEEHLKEENSVTPKESIEVSSELFNQIIAWQKSGSKQKIPLDQYLKQTTTKQEDNVKTDQIIAMLKTTTAKGGECNCLTVTVNSSHDLAPASGGEYYPPESQGGLTTWARKDINGSATDQQLSLNSLDGNNSYEYQDEIASDSGSSNAYSRMSFNYLCTNGVLLPENCGCNKTVYLKTGYYGKGSVDTKIEGILNHRKAQGRVEDGAVVFAIDQYQTQAQVTVLKAGTLQVYRSQHEAWNPEAWMNYAKLAASVTTAILGEVDGATLGDLASQIATVANTPVTLQLGTEDSDGLAEKSFAVQYDGGLVLKPNHILTVQMISRGYIYGNGNRKFKVFSKRYSDYYMSAVLPFNNSNPECCTEKYAKWVSATMGAIGSTALQNSIGSHVTLWNPWSNLTDSDGDGNININTPIGFGTQIKECLICGDPITGLSVTANSIVPGANLRPAKFSWNGQMLVQTYTVYVYNQNGTLIHTVNTADTFLTINLAPGNYSFKVKATCKNGNTVTSSLFPFIVKEVFIRDNPSPFDPGKNSISADTNEVTLYPNPNNGKFIINLSSVKTDKIVIYDMLGRIIKEVKVLKGTDKVDIDLSGYPKGIYSVNILSGDQVISKKMIKQ